LLKIDEAVKNQKSDGTVKNCRARHANPTECGVLTCTPQWLRMQRNAADGAPDHYPPPIGGTFYEAVKIIVFG